MSNRIPDRWLKYTPFGKRIRNTPFVAFKCPLNEAISQSLPPEAKFGLAEIRAKLPQVALIIDLTNTTRYYNPKVLDSYGVEYEKIYVPGHYTPSESKYHEFFHIVDTFLEKNKSDQDKLIGVHCTHGINRTGLFICSYMISKLGYLYEAAVQEFNTSRGHNIERENYLSELKKFETQPLKFEPGSYEKLREGSRLREKGIQIKPLMDMPAPLLPSYRLPAKGSQYSQKRRDKILPLLYHPYQNIRDPRPLRSSDVRSSSVRPPYVASRDDSMMMRRWDRNYNRRRA